MFSRYSRERCYIIAEIGGNFTTFEQGVRLVDAAVASGADAVKLQTYRAETITSRKAIFEMENTGVTSQFDLFRKYEVSEDLHHDIFAYASSKGIDWFSTPSHESDVDLLERQGVGVHKVGSDDAGNLPYLRYLASKGKPIILSTGMCTLDEVREAVDAVFSTGNKKLMLLHAITNYPTHPESVNLRAMQTMARTFPELDVGYSDHTLGPIACICAAAMGARILEKHFTLDKTADGPDHMLSADPEEMAYIVKSVRLFERMRGDGVKRPAATEAVSLQNNRKSIVLECAVSAGDRLERRHLAVKRPGYGIAPKHLDALIGKTARRNLAAEDVLTWEDIS